MTSRQKDEKPARRAPRNYLARREQMRLLMLVGSLMLCIILMNEARKPKNWVWLTRIQEQELTEGEGGGNDIDTRSLPPSVSREKSDFVPGMIEEPSFRFERTGDVSDEEVAYRRAEKDFWQQQLKLLNAEHRRHFPRVLKAVRDDKPLADEDAKGWSETLQELDTRWRENTKEAIDLVTLDTQLTDEDRGTWLTILERLQSHWAEDLQPALAAASKPSTLTEEQRARIDTFQQLFDEISMDGVVDGTPIPWPNETNAWFRLVEHLDRANQSALDETDLPYVGFRQLYQQPADYRGKLIRVRGSAHRVYHLQAPSNIAGVDGYYKFIIALAGTPDNPVLVYSLNLPDGFPEVKDLNVDKDVTDLVDVDVEFTGYFFKLAAYRAGDGIRVAPLIIAKTPTWEPRLPPGDPEPPNMWLLLAAFAGTAILGTAIAAFVMSRHSSGPSQNYVATSSVSSEQFDALANEDISTEPSEELQKMSATEANEEPGGVD